MSDDLPASFLRRNAPETADRYGRYSNDKLWAFGYDAALEATKAADLWRENQRLKAENESLRDDLIDLTAGVDI